MRAVQPVPTILPASATGTAPAPDPQERPARGAPLAALLGAVALAAIFARVAPLHLTTALAAGDLDGYNNLWGMCWLKYALFTLHRNPFYDNYIYYPTGVSLYFHTLNPINGLVLAPIDQFIGYVPAMNLLFVGLLAVDTFCAWL